MTEKTQKVIKKFEPTKSGIMPVPVIEPREKGESPLPDTLPEMLDDESSRRTGNMPVVLVEDFDKSAERESDPVSTHG